MIKFEQRNDEIRARPRIVDEPEHAKIEEEILRRIKSRVAEYVAPGFQRPAAVFIAHLAGVAHPREPLAMSDKERKMLQQWLMLRTNAIQNESWHVLQFWAEMVEDAGRFARERFEMLDQATIRRRRNRLEVVAGNGQAASPTKKVRTVRRKVEIRRVV
jgi:hypothetical protein